MITNKPAIPTINSLSKPDLLKVADRLFNKVESGNMGALNIFAIAKGLLFIASNLIKKLDKQATDEAFEYNKEDRSVYGAKFAYVEGGAIYDYEADEEYSMISEALKKRKALLDSAIKAGHKIVEGDEVINVPPIKGYKKNYLRFDF